MMIKGILSLLLTVVIVSCSEKPERSKLLMDKDKVPPSIIELCKLTGLEMSASPSLDEVVTKTQKAWLQRGKERWEMHLPEHLNKPETIQNIIHVCQEKIGLRDAVLPSKNLQYDGVFFLGATFFRVLDRLDFYLQLVRSGTMRKETPLWVLAGERDLTPSIGETKGNFEAIVNPAKPPIPLPLNETEMIKFVFYHRLPETINALFIDSPKERGSKRATTESTMEAFINDSGVKMGHFLAISNQPYVFYQETALMTRLHELGHKNIHITCVGNAIKDSPQNNDNEAAVLLDNLARTLFNLKRMH